MIHTLKKTRIAAVVMTALLAVMMLLPFMNVYAAEAYTPVSLTATSLGLQEKVEVDETGAVNPEVTYTLKIASAMQVYTDGTTVYGEESGVTNPLTNGTTVASVSYEPGDITGISSMTKAYEDDAAFITALQGMTFDRPGIYYWTLDKEMTSLSTSFTNHNRSQASGTGTALVVRVDDIGGVLTPSVSVNVTDVLGTSGKPAGNKTTLYEDHYTAKVGNFILKKEVTGNQGAKDQYFKFHVAISGIPGMAGYSYSILTTDGPGIISTPKYNENNGNTYNNPTSVTIAEDGTASFDVWLKDQETIVVENFPQTGVFNISESENTGYTVTYAYDDGTQHTGSGNDVQVTMPSGSNLRVVYKNDKASTTPTGILLEVAAPAAGILIAAGLGAIVVATKRKKDEQ